MNFSTLFSDETETAPGIYGGTYFELGVGMCVCVCVVGGGGPGKGGFEASARGANL